MADRAAGARRWAGSLPVLLALLFAAVSGAVPTGPAGGAGPGRLAAAAAGLQAPAQQPSVARQDGVPAITRGGPTTAMAGWAVAGPVCAFRPAASQAWWALTRGAAERRAGVERETYRGRAPPRAA